MNEDSDQDVTVWFKSRFEDLGNWIWGCLHFWLRQLGV